METTAKVYLPKKVASEVETARYRHGMPDQMLKHVLLTDSTYVENWFGRQENMRKLINTLYAGTEIQATPDFISFESAARDFLAGDAFCVYGEKYNIPFLVLMYSKEDKCIYELIEDEKGKITISDLKSEINGDSIKYSKQSTTKTPFDYMNQKDAFFLKHYIYGGKSK